MRQFDEKPLPAGWLLQVFEPFFEELRRMAHRMEYPRKEDAVDLAKLDRLKSEEEERRAARKITSSSPRTG